MPSAVRVIRPQPGPQEEFLRTSSDICIYGGGAGGGKTWALLLESLRHTGNRRFGAVFFRRNSTQIRNEGGLWDESVHLFIPAGGIPKESTLDWTFPSGATVSFRHLEYEKTKYDWQGSQICLECFDELTHFTEGQFWYLVSRNRSMCGVRPYIRATCNPDPDSWVATFIAWWIDQQTGFPIPERCGKLRWMVRLGNEIKWADHPDELASYTMPDENGDPRPIPPKSVTFIPAKVTDNKALLATNPDYISNLMAQSSVERARLMDGNWKIRAETGLFKRGWFGVIDAAPKFIRKVRGWDLAATDTEDTSNAATASVLMGLTEDKNVVILDATQDRLGPAGVVQLIKNTAAQDGKGVYGSIPQDPGQAGKAQVKFLLQELHGYQYHASPESGDKITRAMPLAAQAEAGNVQLLRGAWNAPFLAELESFPTAAVKDQVDAASRAYSELLNAERYKFRLVL